MTDIEKHFDLKKFDLQIKKIEKPAGSVLVVEIDLTGVSNEESFRMLTNMKQAIDPSLENAFGPIGKDYQVIYAPKGQISFTNLSDDDLREMGLQRIKD